MTQSSSPVVLLNGDFIQSENSGWMNNRAFLYGDGFFESMRVHQGRIIHADLHESRIRHAMELLEFEGPDLADFSKLEDKINALIRKNQLSTYVRIRYTLFRQADGFYAPDNNNTGYLISAFPLEDTYTFPGQGKPAIPYTRQAKARGPFSCIKSISSLFYVMAGIAVKHAGVEDCLLLNTSGNVIEALSSNVFFWYNNTLITPPLSEGCVDGVLRRKILDLADKNGIPCREQMIAESEVMLADEIITTNAIRGIQYFSTLNGKTYGSAKARELHELLLASL